MVHTVTERLRANLFGTALAEEFWSDALPVVVKNINKNPLKLPNGKTPEEEVAGEKPWLDYAYPFGCDDTQRSERDPDSRQ